jgi:hypothetical protein
MRTAAGSRNRPAARLAAGFLATALVAAAACSDSAAPTPPSQPSAPSPQPTPTPTPTPPAPPVLNAGTVFASSAWWAGSPYPLAPLVGVQVNSVRTASIPVFWSATNGGTIASPISGSTDGQGVSRCPAWTLGAVGVDSVTATIGPAPGGTDVLRVSVSVVALPAPSRFAEYQLVLIDGFPPPTAKQVEFDILGGLLRLGDNGTLEWIETDGGTLTVGDPALLFGAGRYSIANGAIAFGPIPGAEGSRFPGDSARISGDTITTSFLKGISLGLDPDTVLHVETYVRTSGPSISGRFVRRR